MQTSGINLGLSPQRVELMTAAPQVPPTLRDVPKNELEEKFQEFVGTAFFGQLMKAMRRSVAKPADFHGGRAEEIFQAQLDQTLIEQLAAEHGASFGRGLYERFRQGIDPVDFAAPVALNGTVGADNAAATLPRL